jgi:hypothetical protein
MMDGTPVYDIKPYLPYVECPDFAIGGFTDEIEYRLLDVEIPEGLLNKLPENLRSLLIEVLENDPRPQYIDTPERIFGFLFDKFEVKFKVDGTDLTVVSIEENK